MSSERGVLQGHGGVAGCRNIHLEIAADEELASHVGQCFLWGDGVMFIVKWANFVTGVACCRAKVVKLRSRLCPRFGWKWDRGSLRD